MLKKIITLLLIFSFSISFAKNKDVPVEEIRRFTTVFNLIKKYYVNEVDDKKLFNSAIKGTLAELDPHSAYFEVDEFEEIEEDSNGVFGGLGISYTLEDGYARVISVLEGSPAAIAGVQSEDKIIKVDNKILRGLSLLEINRLMRGEPGTKVDLTIIRKTSIAPLVLNLVRDVIKSQNTTALMLENTLYIKVPLFTTNSGKEVIQAIQKKKRNNKFSSIILDLRNNPGGVVNAAVTMADAFLDKDKIGFDQKIVYSDGRVKDIQIVKKSITKDLTNNTPLIVLINGGSASASEIVAGALSDHNRAIIVGERSFGKGSMQSVIPLQGDYGMKITTSLYYTPAGTSIQGRGISPDISVSDINIENMKLRAKGLQIKESDFPKHIKNKQKAVKKNHKSLNTSKEEIELEKKILEHDYQVQQAINILKALEIKTEKNK